MKNIFRKMSNRVSLWAGSPFVFISAVAVIILWASLGPRTDYSDTWQLVINTGTTIVTFLMVFLIQNTQNRDSKATQLKLDELIKSNAKARDAFVGLEDISDDELLELTEEFRRLHERSPQLAAVRKLSKRLEAEHMKRSGLKNISGKVITTMLNPVAIGSKKDKDDPGPKSK